jgi:hypothetical protein
MGIAKQWWWPFGDPTKSHWPNGVAREETVAAFAAAFKALGFVPCDRADVETGYEKIALFVDQDGCPTHAARRLPTGRWTSKLGFREDIEHDLNALEGETYGRVALIMKRAQSVE